MLPLNGSPIVETVLPFAKKLDELGVPYAIGGSIASSVFGAARATQDVDIVSDLRSEAVPALVAALEGEFYIDADMILEAIRNRSSFNLVHLKTMIKIDVFIMKEREFDRGALARRSPQEIAPDSGVKFYVTSAEDIILHKIEWFIAGDRQSERQWTDLLAVIKIAGEKLDRGYLVKWADELGVASDLRKAFKDASYEHPQK